MLFRSLHEADEPVELAVPALPDDVDLSADGDESVPSQLLRRRGQRVRLDDDDARLRADAEAREAGD